MSDAIPPLAADALLSMLLPVWQFAIGTCVLITLVVSARRLAKRGRSRMTTALVVTGGAIIGLTVIGWLLSGL